MADTPPDSLSERIAGLSAFAGRQNGPHPPPPQPNADQPIGPVETPSDGELASGNAESASATSINERPPTDGPGNNYTWATALARISKRAPVEPSVAQVAPGDLLADRYRLVEIAGQGGFGMVFRAIDLKLERVVALKLLHPAHSRLQRHRVRLESEARVAARIKHPHVVSVIDVGSDPGAGTYLVMEWIDGQPLDKWLSRSSNERLRDIATLVANVARGLAAAHALQLVHRDIKCANLLVDSQGQVKVVDFGLAIDEEKLAELSLTEQFAGTLPYMSPEQLSSKRTIDHRTDIYSLGVVLYELIADTRPFRGTMAATIEQIERNEPAPLREMNPACPRDLATIAAKCLRGVPEQRYQSADALANDLDAWLAGKPIAARPVGRAERLWKLAKRFPVVASLSVAIVAAAIVSTSLAFQLYRKNERLDRALQVAYHMVRGVSNKKLASLDDLYISFVRGEATLAENERLASPHVFSAFVGMQTACDNLLQSHDRDAFPFGAVKAYWSLKSALAAQAAIQELNAALANDDKLALAWLMRAHIRQELAEDPPASILPDWERAAQLAPETSAAWSGRGWCLFKLGESERAAESFRRALEIDPKNEYACVGCGHALYQLSKYSDAATMYERSLAMDSRYQLREASRWHGVPCELLSSCYSHLAVEAVKRQEYESDSRLLMWAIGFGPREDLPLLWDNLRITIMVLEPNVAATLATDLRDLPQVFDKKRIATPKQLVALIADEVAGLAEPDDWRRLFDASVADPTFAEDLNSSFREGFNAWAQSRPTIPPSIRFQQPK